MLIIGFHGILNLVRFAHPPEAEHDGTMEYWVYSCSIWLKNNTVHGIDQMAHEFIEPKLA